MGRKGDSVAVERSVRAVSRKLQRALAADRPPVTPGPAAPEDAAAAAKLRYVSDTDPGIRRLGTGKVCRYLRPDGRPVRDAETLARIRSLAIPPAWTDVWICPFAEGHIQAVGRDARGRKQYRYHPRWREVRDRTKFGRMIEFARVLPRVRAAVEADLALPGLPKRKVLAALASLLERTCIRVGCDEYARSNRHFGLTTLLDRHVTIEGPRLRFRFTGKSGKAHEVGLQDAHLARVVRNCQEIPGQRLFQYRDADGRPAAVTSGDVNEYLREISGGDYTAKDFRTWAGTVFVAETLLAAAVPTSVAAGRREILAAIDAAAERLGNTRTVCKNSYVHPAVLDAFTEGWMREPRPARSGASRRSGRPRSAGGIPRSLDAAERATLRILIAAAHPRPAARARPARAQRAAGGERPASRRAA
jgi:DNA topoisomerase-1